MALFDWFLADMVPFDFTISSINIALTLTGAIVISKLLSSWIMWSSALHMFGKTWISSVSHRLWNFLRVQVCSVSSFPGSWRRHHLTTLSAHLQGIHMAWWLVYSVSDLTLIESKNPFIISQNSAIPVTSSLPLSLRAMATDLLSTWTANLAFILLKEVSTMWSMVSFGRLCRANSWSL